MTDLTPAQLTAYRTRLLGLRDELTGAEESTADWRKKFTEKLNDDAEIEKVAVDMKTAYDAVLAVTDAQGLWAAVGVEKGEMPADAYAWMQ